ncbi:hypothetical protein [Bifidobacterium sp. SO1]|uniref:hypothetical protein n=1 Tax=Bifidobacterium sp. SO1 TaxID=2809029 RepID=UPI001BDBFB3E|nr:hypothetical protein [Bifidobacterium sp. SO1]MBT1162558.1 hypothetical protein [Bifidobacterium sp. SO1]
MALTVKERADALQVAAQKGSRITLTDLSRGNKWRQELSDKGILELVDRSDTMAFILSADAMKELLDELDRSEAELETLSAQELFDARKNRTTLQSGQALENTAIASFENRKKQLLGILKDGESQQ